nr:oxysterol-binding protein-related protein 1B-like isoform X2 [Physcomitrium patens]|eukprot:XP_024386741.1 oxysterol-binding protein-related protein 1B-like isoform X2 [Physcomitrella patens]
MGEWVAATACTVIGLSRTFHLQRQEKISLSFRREVSSIRYSQSDDKKFYIYTGTKTLYLRAETNADRSDWVGILQAAKELFPRGSLLVGVVTPSEEITISTDKLRLKLLDFGLSEEQVKECEDIMLGEFADVKEQLRVIQQRRLTLLERLRMLEAEKVELETTVVDEMRSHGGAEIRELKKYYGGSDSESDEDNDDHKGGVEVDSDDEEDVFFEAKETLRSSANPPKHHLESPSDGEVSMDIVGFDYPKVPRRKSLPNPKEKEKNVSLWSMIKDNIGKDLTKVCLPVYFNEPISSLQRAFEDVEYSYLLDRAAEYGRRGNSLMRLLSIGAFAVSGYSSTEGRTCKPFNPLLGETYEADYPDKGLRFCSEKVSHHPMIVACHCEGRGWKFWGDSNLKSKFWGRSIQLDPVGILTLKFDDGEVFQWTKVTTSIYNLILGKLYVDHYGTMRIQGNRHLSIKLKFKEQSIIDRNPHQVQGFVHDKSGIKIATLFGKWDESMYYIMGDISEKPKHYDPMSEAVLLWRAAPPPEKLTRYGLTTFSMTSNEMTPGLREKLPPTDSRLRPDQRHLENGEYDAANSEKLRLEQKQRRARALQEKGWQPRWFRKGKGKDTYEYIGGYWEARDKGRWDGCPEIFGPDPAGENCVMD